MIWQIQTKKSQIVNFNHDQLCTKAVKRDTPQTSSQSINIKQKIPIKKTLQQLIQLLHHYSPISKIVEVSQLRNNKKVHIKKYRQCVYWGEITSINNRQGKGIMLYTNGRIYQGQWKSNYKCGKGYQKFLNGSIYQGAYENGKPHGYGKYQWQNGQLYQGQWVDGLKDGSGIWRGSQGDSYIGQWKHGKAHGYGVHTWINGNRYQGQFQQCLKHGQGIDKFANGDSYNGSYSNGKPQGYGQYFWDNGSSYKGNFKNGLRNGQGIFKTSKTNYDTYQGSFVDQKKDGYGVFNWANGSKYMGGYKNDLRQGFGEMYWIDGNIYKGEWEAGEQIGQNLYSPSQQLCIQFPKNPLEDVFEHFNPQDSCQFGKFEEYNKFSQPCRPEVADLKRFRARGINGRQKSRNQNSSSNISGGFMLTKNFVTEAVVCNKRGGQKLISGPSKLSFKGEKTCPTSFPSNKSTRIRHSQSTSQRKNLSSSYYQKRNDLVLSRNTPAFQQFNPQCIQFGSRNSLKVKPRVIKSSGGMRNHVSKDCFWEEMNFSRNAILNNFEQDNNQFVRSKKNNSQYF